MNASGIHHGGGLDAAIARYGGGRGEWLDLSTGINPQPWPVPQLPHESWARLPDTGALQRLIEAARVYYVVPAGFEVAPAPGTQALIEALPRILPGTTATVIAPQAGTYGEHAYCCLKQGRRVRHVSGVAEVQSQERLAIIVRPNNPDGSVANRSELLRLHDRLAANDGWLVVDEAFCDPVPDTSLIGQKLERAIILRSFGKFFGLAGLRLGFAVCAGDMSAELGKWFGPWAVSGPALEIGAKALADIRWTSDTIASLQSGSRQLESLLEANGFSIAGKNALFVLGRRSDAGAWFSALCERRILVRAFEHDPVLLRLGLPGGEVSFGRLEASMREISEQFGR